MNRTTQRRRTIVALVTCALAPFVGVSSAEAAEITVTDSTGDVREGEGRLAPRVSNGDITNVSYDHRAARVVIRAEYVELLRPQSNNSTLVFATRMRTNEGAYRVAFTDADAGEPQGATFLTNRRGEVRCNVDERIDYFGNAIQVRIPRTCLSRPQWIRFTSFHATETADRVTYDHPHDDGPDPTAWTSRVLHD
jgi:hypothetical protein